MVSSFYLRRFIWWNTRPISAGRDHEKRTQESAPRRINRRGKNSPPPFYSVESVPIDDTDDSRADRADRVAVPRAVASSLHGPAATSGVRTRMRWIVPRQGRISSTAMV